MDYNKPSRISTEVNLYLKVIFFRLSDFFFRMVAPLEGSRDFQWAPAKPR